MLIRWWFFSTCSFFGGKTELFFWDLETAVICWCWFDGDFYGDLMGHSWNIKRHIDIILIGLLKRGWNNFRPSSSKLIKKTIDNHGSWGFIYKMVICWVFHDESHISWYLYWLSIHRGTGHPSKTYHSRHSSEICSQPRVVHLMATIAGWLFCHNLMTRGYY